MTLSVSALWNEIRKEASEIVDNEPALASYFYAAILKHQQLSDALSFALASKLGSKTLPAMSLQELISGEIRKRPALLDIVAADIQAVRDRDPACENYCQPLLYFKGFHALQAYRVSHELWLQGRELLASHLHNKISQTFSVDIHPAAQLGRGIMVDHATALVIGETSILGDNISLLHSVTLGGTGCEKGKRHPTVGDGVLISVGAKILGNIVIGDGAKIAAGSLVLSDIPANTTVAGVPAKAVGNNSSGMPAISMEQFWQKLNCDE